MRAQLRRFLLVSIVTLAIDAGLYALLVHLDAVPPGWAKRLSFAAAMCWAFLGNKYYTFRRRALRLHEPPLFAALYVLALAVNSLTHDLVFLIMRHHLAAFSLACALSATSTFLGQKWVVFRGQQVRPTDASDA